MSLDDETDFGTVVRRAQEAMRRATLELDTLRAERAELIAALEKVLPLGRDGFGHAGDPKCDECRVLADAAALLKRLVG